MKKLLLITLLLVFSFSFGQQVERTDSNAVKSTPVATITSISASPNPFTVKTNIRFNSTKIQKVVFSVKNLLGKVVYEESVEAKRGYNSIPFDRNNITKGMYIYSLQTESEIVSKRLVIR